MLAPRDLTIPKALNTSLILKLIQKYHPDHTEAQTSVVSAMIVQATPHGLKEAQNGNYTMTVNQSTLHALTVDMRMMVDQITLLVRARAETIESASIIARNILLSHAEVLSASLTVTLGRSTHPNLAEATAM